jgi:cell wall-associated NlpC family hydrolase
VPRKGQTLNRKVTQQILKASSQLRTIGERLNFISAQFLGKPYIIGPLIGSDTEPEMFTATYNGFDCVTYLETCLALAWAQKAEEVNDLLRAIRYRNGNVAWEDRLHYTTDWNQYHLQRGDFADVTRGDDTLTRTKEINWLKALKPRTITYRYFPKRKLSKVRKQFRDGDLIYFASTRKGLDIFHVGLLVWVNGKLMLRHAAKSKGGVVEQALAEFVKGNTMPGFIVARPKEVVS